MMPIIDWNRIVTTKNEEGKEAVRALGGINLYAKTEKILEQAINHGCKTMSNCLATKITASRSGLWKLINVEYNQDDIDERILGALLGRCLSLGQIALFTWLRVTSDGAGQECEFYVQERRLVEFREIEKKLIEKLHCGTLLSPSSVADEFGIGQDSAYHFLFHLAYCGQAVAVGSENKILRWPKELDNAIGDNKFK